MKTARWIAVGVLVASACCVDVMHAALVLLVALVVKP